MTTALDRILEYKADEVAELKRTRSMSALEREASLADPCRGFSDRMFSVAEKGRNAVICEIKRRSPSAGQIKDIASPNEAARAYETGGAACISVLTDGPSFGGSNDDLRAVRSSVKLPVLRKDFMIDVSQVLEARSIGADAILVIMAAVDDELALDLHAAAQDLGMSVLIEVHDEVELERAMKLSSPLLGVNNRDLKTFTTDLGITERLSKYIPNDRLLIAESGVRDAEDVKRLRKSNARGFLVGESVMSAENTSDAVQALVNVR